METVIRIHSNNDVNGNPQRGWIVQQYATDPVFIDEGHRGYSALTDAGYSGGIDITVNVTQAEYRRLKREYSNV